MCLLRGSGPYGVNRYPEPVNRRIATLLIALVPLFGLGIVGSVAAVPFVALGPGPTFNTLGMIDGKQVVDVKGVPVQPTSGNLNMTTVSVREELSIFEAFGFWLSNDHGIVPRSEIYPPGQTREQVDKSNAADFKNSEQNAEVAALRYLKYPIGVKVGRIATKGPAAAVLRTGDEVISINGRAATSATAVQTAVSHAEPGSDAAIVLRRGGVVRTQTVRLGARPDDPSKGYLGIGLNEIPETPISIDFNLADIGGPSAGLMFSLAVVDKLTTDRLGAGRFVAGTGTIDGSGNVGPIGGIRYKMIAARRAGANTFLVPADNCGEARKHTPDGLRLVRVDTLSNAVLSLESLESGGSAPACSP